MLANLECYYPYHVFQFHSSVIEVTRLKSEWKVTVKNTVKDSSNIEEYLFDSVMVCNGLVISSSTAREILLLVVVLIFPEILTT